MRSPLDELDHPTRVAHLVWIAGSTADPHDCAATAAGSKTDATARLLAAWCATDPADVDDALVLAEHLADLDLEPGPWSSPIIAVDVLTATRRRLAALED